MRIARNAQQRVATPSDSIPRYHALTHICVLGPKELIMLFINNVICSGALIHWEIMHTILGLPATYLLAGVITTLIISFTYTIGY